MRLPGLFVLGTDTGVGKTRVACAIARHLAETGVRVGVIKPLATGGRVVEGRVECDDPVALAEAAGWGNGGVPLARVNPIAFEEPLAPPVAARLHDVHLAFEGVRGLVFGCLDWWAGRAELIVAEGVGGVCCPIAEDATLLELAEALDFPVVLVARRGLGTLGHTLAAVELLEGRALRLAGVILNETSRDVHDLARETNPMELARRLEGVAILDVLDYDESGRFIPPSFRLVDWSELAKPSRRLTPSV